MPRAAARLTPPRGGVHDEVRVDGDAIDPGAIRRGVDGRARTARRGSDPRGNRSPLRSGRDWRHRRLAAPRESGARRHCERRQPPRASQPRSGMHRRRQRGPGGSREASELELFPSPWSAPQAQPICGRVEPSHHRRIARMRGRFTVFVNAKWKCPNLPQVEMSYSGRAGQAVRSAAIRIRFFSLSVILGFASRSRSRWRCCSAIHSRVSARCLFPTIAPCVILASSLGCAW